MEPVASQQLPAEFGDYTLKELIAYGGTSEIFRAETGGLSGFRKVVVIKRILPQYSGDRLFVNMMIDEAKLCARLQHENIVQIFDLGRLQDRYFIAMEYVHGVDLGKLLQTLVDKDAFLPEELGCHILSEALAGLDYAHHATGKDGQPLNIIHRDFNPTNILVSFTGEIRVSDFGIAKATDRSSKTFTGFLKGKFGYMSPEQVDCRPVDARSDIFTAGITLWELLAHQRMFEHSSFLAMLQKIRHARVPSLKKAVPQVPEELAAIVSKALQRDPGKRFQTAAAFKDSLDAYLRKKNQVIQAAHLEGFLTDLFSDRIAAERHHMGIPADGEMPPYEEEEEEEAATVPGRPFDQDRVPTVTVDQNPLDFPEEEATDEVDMATYAAAQKEAHLEMGWVRLHFERKEFWEAMNVLSQVLERLSEHEEAVQLHARAKQALVEQLFEKLEDLDRVPRLKIEQKELVQKDFDHKTGFFISLVDGHLSYDEILAVCGQPTLDGLHTLADLLDEGVITAT